MYWLYNTALRGKEATPPSQWKVWERIKSSNNFWTNSVHALCGGKLPDRMFTPDERGRLGVRPCLSWRVLGMANYKSHTTVSRNGNSVDLVDCFHRDGRIWCLVDDFEFGGGA